MCLWEAEIKVGVYSLNLRLASLILTIIVKLWFWWLGALTKLCVHHFWVYQRVVEYWVWCQDGSVTSVIWRWCHAGYGTSALELCASNRDIMTRSWISDYRDYVTRHPICASDGVDTYPAPALARDYPILGRYTQYYGILRLIQIYIFL